MNYQISTIEHQVGLKLFPDVTINHMAMAEREQLMTCVQSMPFKWYTINLGLVSWVNIVGMWTLLPILYFAEQNDRPLFLLQVHAGVRDALLKANLCERECIVEDWVESLVRVRLSHELFGQAIKDYASDEKGRVATEYLP